VRQVVFVANVHIGDIRKLVKYVFCTFISTHPSYLLTSDLTSVQRPYGVKTTDAVPLRVNIACMCYVLKTYPASKQFLVHFKFLTGLSTSMWSFVIQVVLVQSPVPHFPVVHFLIFHFQRLFLTAAIHLPPQTCDVSHLSVSSQVQSYPPTAEQLEVTDAALQVQELKADKQTQTFYYRAMHVVLARYCYRKSSVRPSVRPSVCLSVCL